MKERKEMEVPLMSEEEKDERIRQEYKYQQNLLELVRTFMLMGYSRSDIFEAVKSLKYEVSETQIDFYCEFISDRKDKKTIQEINAELFRFLWEIEPPKLPEDPEPEKPETRKPVESYLCRIVILNLLKDRVEYLISVLNAGHFEMTHFINAGYDTHYVETMKTIIEKNPEMHSRDIAKEVYRILYQEEKHKEGVLFSIDKIDFVGMFEACRDKYENRRKKYENGGKQYE